MRMNTNKTDADLILKIAKRAAKLAPSGAVSVTETAMDLTAVHLNGCPLKLSELADADNFNLSHDVFGIREHLNRDSGKLGGCFLPRFAR